MSVFIYKLNHSFSAKLDGTLVCFSTWLLNAGIEALIQFLNLPWIVRGVGKSNSTMPKLRNFHNIKSLSFEVDLLKIVTLPTITFDEVELGLKPTPN